MKKNDAKSTVLVISMGFLFLYLVFTWKWALIVSFIIGVMGAISIYLSRKIEWLWMKLAMILGYIVPNVLLTLVFFLFLVPIATISKLFKKDTLMLSKKYKSHFLSIQSNITKESFEKIW